MKKNTQFKIKNWKRPISNQSNKDTNINKPEPKNNIKNKTLNKVSLNFKKKINIQTEKIKKFGLYTLKYLTNTKFFQEEMHYSYKTSEGASLMNTRISPNDKKAIYGDSDGSIYSINTSSLVKKKLPLHNSYPITSIRFVNQDDFLFTNSNGYIYLNSNKLSIYAREEEDIICSDFNLKNNYYITAGKDANIRVYDFKNNSIIKTFDKGNYANKGHTNRIFNVVFDKENQNIIYSGGWDGIVLQWDLRLKGVQNSIIGPIISGETIDIKNNNLLIGTQKVDNNLELYDLRNFKKFSDLKFNKKYYFNSAYIYSCQFSKQDNSIAVGTSGDNFISLFKFTTFYEEYWRLNNFRKGIYSLDFGNNSNMLSFGTGSEEMILLKNI